MFSNLPGWGGGLESGKLKSAQNLCCICIGARLFKYGLYSSVMVTHDLHANSTTVRCYRLFKKKDD